MLLTPNNSCFNSSMVQSLEVILEFQRPHRSSLELFIGKGSERCAGVYSEVQHLTTLQAIIYYYTQLITTIAYSRMSFHKYYYVFCGRPSEFSRQDCYYDSNGSLHRMRLLHWAFTSLFNPFGCSSFVRFCLQISWFFNTITSNRDPIFVSRFWRESLKFK